MKRVLFTTAWFPNRKVAGDGVFVQKHAQAVAMFCDVAVLMVQTDRNVRPLHVDIEASSPSAAPYFTCLVYVPKVTFELPVITSMLRLFWLFIGYMKGYHYIRKNHWKGQRPEVCHVNVLTRAAALPWLLKKVHHIPYIITEHWTRYHRQGAFPKNRLQLWFTKQVVKEADYVCPVSLNLEQAMKKWGLENRHYVRVGNVVLPMPECKAGFRRSPAMGTRFVHVSWMRDDAKNISGILRTLAALAKENQHWHFDFIGEGNDKEKLIAYAEELGLLEKQLVTFLSAHNSEELAGILPQYDALVMFSYFENQPVSILEALAAGLPVIATAVGDIPKMLAQHRGITVEPGNEQQLLDVLYAFVSLAGSQRNDEALRAARHQYVTDHHSAEVIGRQFSVLYPSRS